MYSVATVRSEVESLSPRHGFLSVRVPDDDGPALRLGARRRLLVALVADDDLEGGGEVARIRSFVAFVNA